MPKVQKALNSINIPHRTLQAVSSLSDQQFLLSPEIRVLSDKAYDERPFSDAEDAVVLCLEESFLRI